MRQTACGWRVWSRCVPSSMAKKTGLILIGMPGMEKRLARYPQFYSRIGFVHEFRPLGAKEIRQLLDQHWTPPGVRLPQRPKRGDESRGRSGPREPRNRAGVSARVGESNALDFRARRFRDNKRDGKR